MDKNVPNNKKIHEPPIINDEYLKKVYRYDENTKKYYTKKIDPVLKNKEDLNYNQNELISNQDINNQIQNQANNLQQDKQKFNKHNKQNKNHIKQSYRYR
ncbi:hypothetical protein PPERSA_07713 [Pseudocohnilembus persalinus]|uniref:Uncharacterized protein n=1 Tax=Pseudocohnilembus persalinus TaxID=266149 RepID=A0A0V0R9N1_PSEPJ|nr:hypothetical protein PPERSA_07713 [Pseudocohnilembus persalinus]|eukprot:KRX11188.1 hypothetical protein PPERSA_07713 [Pseudocohnilembus persalinus]